MAELSRGRVARARGALRSIGRLPRAFAILTLLVAVFGSLNALEGDWIAALILMPPALLLAFVSLRVKAWIEADALIIRSYWRTQRIPLSRIRSVMPMPYEGWWVMQGPSIGLYHLAIGVSDYPETVCLVRSMRRIVEEISQITGADR